MMMMMMLLGHVWPSLVPMPPKQSPILTWITAHDAGRRRRGGGEVRVRGEVLGASVKGEGGVQGLRRGVRAAQTAEQRVIHRMHETGR